MTITTDNYEQYLFQYQEGMLNTEERKAVEAFLQAHPDKAEELAFYASAPRLEKSEAHFPEPSKLRHTDFTPALRWASAAMIAALLAVGATLLWPKQEPLQPMVAETKVESETPQPVLKTIDTLPITKQQSPTLPLMAQAEHIEELPFVEEEADSTLGFEIEMPTSEPEYIAEAVEVPSDDTVVYLYTEVYMDSLALAYEMVSDTTASPREPFLSRTRNMVRNYLHERVAQIGERYRHYYSEAREYLSLN